MIVQKYRSIEVSKDIIKSKIVEDIQLSDKVLVFNYEGQWVVVPLFLIIKYPIIYFKNGDIYGSIVCCLITLRCMYVYEKVRWEGYNGIDAVFSNLSGDKLGFEAKYDKDGNKLVEYKRGQIKIQSLRSALIEYGDLRYLHLQVNKSDLIPFEYFNSMLNYNNEKIENKDYHPKTMCTIIQYQSNSSVKTTVLIPKDVSKTSIVGYEPRKGGIDEYLASFTEKLIEKKSFIINMLLYTATELYKDAKYIAL